jgi:hypothetical protein
LEASESRQAVHIEARWNGRLRLTARQNPSGAGALAAQAIDDVGAPDVADGLEAVAVRWAPESFDDAAQILADDPEWIHDRSVGIAVLAAAAPSLSRLHAALDREVDAFENQLAEDPDDRLVVWPAYAALASAATAMGRLDAFDRLVALSGATAGAIFATTRGAARRSNPDDAIASRVAAALRRCAAGPARPAPHCRVQSEVLLDSSW